MPNDSKTDSVQRSVCCLERIAGQLLAEARDRKRRAQTRLLEMRGDWMRTSIRGPMLPNGRPSLQWVFYSNAVRNHKRATAELAALLRVLPKRWLRVHR